MASLRLLVASLALTVPLAGRAGAQEAAEEPVRIKEEAPRERRGDLPAPPKKRPGRPTVTWIGFKAEGGGARVFVQASHAITFDQRVQGAELIVTLNDVRLGHYNFQRFMDTSFFGTPVKIVQARPTKRGVELHVKFKGNAAQKAEARTETAQDGYHYLYLSFGG